MKLKFKCIVLLSLVVIVAIKAKDVNAALQSRPGIIPLRDLVSTEFYKEIRDMETKGGVLGLNATFETQNKTYVETSASNNIDVHMCKNTEWGAAIMLQLSSYGSGNQKLTNSYNDKTNIYGITASTTGNMTGIFGMYSRFSGHHMSAGIVEEMNESLAGNMKNAKNRYVDKYRNNTSSDYSDYSRYIPGDATFEIQSFYNNSPLFPNAIMGLFARRGAYSYSAHKGTSYYNYGSIATIWCGNGI